jgi:hypothetical protein
MLASALVLATAAGIAAPDDQEARRRQAWERQLHAQLDRSDKDIQVLESRLFALENNRSANDAAREAEKQALRDQIERMDHDQEPIEKCLEKLEHDEPLNRVSCPFHDDSGPAAPATIEQPPKPSMAAAPPQPAMPPPRIAPPSAPSPQLAPSPVPSPQHGPVLRKADDPAPYEKAVISRVSMFRYNPYRWVPVGTHQLAVYNTYEEAFLLDLDGDCQGLLTTERIQIENFSTRVVAGKDAVIADGQRCLITGIRELYVNRLPH